MTASETTTPGIALRNRWPLAAGLAVGVLIAVDPGTWSPADVSTWGLPVLALVYLMFGVARQAFRTPGALAPQLAGRALFGATAVLAMVADPVAGKYVVVAGWVAHAAWDVVHHRTGKIVPRGYAEFCAALDLVVAFVVAFAR